MLGVQLVVQFTHPPGELLLFHLVVACLDCVCSIVKAFDQDLLGKEPVEKIYNYTYLVESGSPKPTCFAVLIQKQQLLHVGAAAIADDT